MRILGLYSHPEHVCFRYRLRAFRPFLEDAGHEVAFCGWPRWWYFDAGFLQKVGAADLVVVQRKLLPSWQLRRLRRAARTLVFDFDDAVFLRDSFARRGLDSERRLRRFVHMVHAADVVVAGNDFLREQALAWHMPERTYLVPTCIDFDKYRLADHAADKNGTELVWIGSGSTLKGLEQIAPWLDFLSESVNGLKLKIICDRPLNLGRLPTHFCPWSEDSEAGELASADIGISWLPGDRWSEGKCCVKILQYMAAGLPVIANPVGLQARLVRHGETGFLVESVQEWRTALERLARDAGLRRRMGAQGRLLVENKFHVTQGAAAWLDLLKTVRRGQAALPLA